MPFTSTLPLIVSTGLIQNEDQGVLELVRQLTESYINRPSTIILTTIPMSGNSYNLRYSAVSLTTIYCLDDMQNQQSVRLAREADPGGERTIGLLVSDDKHSSLTRISHRYPHEA